MSVVRGVLPNEDNLAVAFQAKRRQDGGIGIQLGDELECAIEHFLVTPHDSTNYSGSVIARALYCMDDGDIAVVSESGVAVTYSVTAGTILPVKSKRVNATGTTLTYGQIVAWV